VLDDFEAFDIATTGTTPRGRRGGNGPPEAPDETTRRLVEFLA